MTDKQKLLTVVIVSLLSIIGLYGFHQYKIVSTKAVEIEFHQVEDPKTTIIGMWNEESPDDTQTQRRIIFTDTAFTIVYQDGITPLENTVILEGSYRLTNDNRTITLIGNTGEVVRSICIETADASDLTTISIGGDKSSYFYGTKATDETDPTQLTVEAMQKKDSQDNTVTYLSPSGK